MIALPQLISTAARISQYVSLPICSLSPSIARDRPSNSFIIATPPLRIREEPGESGGLQVAGRNANSRLRAHFHRAPLHRLVQPWFVAEREEYLSGEEDGGDKDLEKVVHQRRLAPFIDVTPELQRPADAETNKEP